MVAVVASPQKHTTMGTAHHFFVHLDRSAYDLGSWQKASGLKVSWQMCEYRSGDSNHVRQYPGNPSYERIRLSRVACPDSAVVRRWLASLSAEHDPISGVIQMLSSDLKPIIEWTLRDLFPVSWSIGEFDAGGPKAIVETLELAHTGFLDDSVKYRRS
ncbi:phage tail protein [Actinocatenispora thailandica]|uniref:Phage tail protein n=1 Tax=Actinocatenispora thailandica TaxID=227318 RepID=A0A7R7DT09_9ACTN|nr:phage tail protein [Actinocatenispora thailandica]BCJ37201.1 phage tail protein [Actinocatenispora thailandica]